MTKYIKKPVIIDAVQFDGTWESVESFVDNDAVWWSGFDGKQRLSIKTLEGQMTAQPGDYIIRGVENEYYPCKPGIFEKTYEKFEE